MQGMRCFIKRPHKQQQANIDSSGKLLKEDDAVVMVMAIVVGQRVWLLTCRTDGVRGGRKRRTKLCLSLEHRAHGSLLPCSLRSVGRSAGRRWVGVMYSRLRYD
jgi:hypothetical protein